MKKNELSDLYLNSPGSPELAARLGEESMSKGLLEGLSGSSKALVMASVHEKMQTTHLVIIPEKEDAAYFYNDIVTLSGDEGIFFFPSTYKRSVQYEQTEPANIVLRTEVLNHLASGKRKGIIVTYPESVMEKVISRKNLKKNTFQVAKGDKLSLDFLEEMLQEYNFDRVDFVFEPGQYSIRGSIADVF
jgi:transcription-repair coupling factor (superfamily II helicase)